MTDRHARAARAPDELAHSLRDGLLQDLLAVSMLIEGACARVDERDETTARELLGEAGATLRVDIETVRALIERVRAGAGGAAGLAPERMRGGPSQH